MFLNTPFSNYLEYILDNKVLSNKQLINIYKKNKTKLKSNLINFANCLPIYENRVEQLAVFITIITKDPHFLDKNKFCYNLFIQGIKYLLADEDIEDVDELLDIAGIIKDEVSNYTLCCGLIGYCNNEIHQGLQYFYNNHEPINLTLYNINCIDSFTNNYEPPKPIEGFPPRLISIISKYSPIGLTTLEEGLQVIKMQVEQLRGVIKEHDSLIKDITKLAKRAREDIEENNNIVRKLSNNIDRVSGVLQAELELRKSAQAEWNKKFETSEKERKERQAELEKKIATNEMKDK